MGADLTADRIPPNVPGMTGCGVMKRLPRPMKAPMSTALGGELASDRHNAMLDGKMNELSSGVQPVRFHHLIFVKFNGAG